MAFCANCGTKNDEGSAFCANCGAPVDSGPAKPAMNSPPQQQQQQQSSYQPFQGHPGNQPQQYQGQPQQYNQYGGYNQGYGGYAPPPGYRTGWLTFAIVIHWIYTILVGIVGMIAFSASNDLSADFVEVEILRTFALILLSIAFLYGVVAYHLAKYSSTARGTAIVLSILSLIGTFASGIGAIVSILVLYGLGFHEETKQLFQNPPLQR